MRSKVDTRTLNASLKKDMSRLASDEKGAVLIIGVFAAALLAGALFLMMGTIDAINHREVMQDAADGAAFSAATTHARAMNIMALLNIVKLSNVAVFTALAGIVGALISSGTSLRGLSLGAIVALSAAPPSPSTQTLAQLLVNFDEDIEPILESAELSQEALTYVMTPTETTLQNYFKDPQVFTENNGTPEQHRAIVQTSSTLSVDVCDIPTTPTESAPVVLPMMRALIDIAIPRHGVAAATPPPISRPRNIFDFLRDAIRRGRLGIGGGLASPLTAAETSVEMATRLCEAEAHPLFDQWPLRTLGNTNEYNSADLSLRFYAFRDDVPTRMEQGVGIATWATNAPAQDLENLRETAGKIAWSQASYFPTFTTEPSQALWHLDWKASLSRFRPSGSPTFRDDIERGCQSAGLSECRDIANAVEALTPASKH